MDHFDKDDFEMRKQSILQGEKPEKKGIERLIEAYLDIFRVHNRENVWKIQIIDFIIVLILALLFKRFLIRFYNYLCGPKGVELNKKQFEYGPNSFSRNVFEIIGVIWSILSIIITIPYSRLNGAYTYLCYWGWCSMLLVNVPSALNNRTLKRFLMKYVVFFSMGVIATANWSYFYYGFHNGQWDYLLIHMLPPIWAFIWVIANIRDFDDDVNLLHSNSAIFAFILTNYLIVIASWRHFNIPHIVYAMFYMENMYYYGALFPASLNFTLLLVFCIARIIWVRNFKEKTN